jgi:hypothetical protein
MKQIAWMVMVGAALGCGNGTLATGPGGTGGAVSTGGTSTIGGHGGGAGAGGIGGEVGGAGGAAGGGGHGVAGARGGEVPGCLQDLWAACSIGGSCHEDEAISGSYCFASGTSVTVDPPNPCSAVDGGVAHQTVTVRTPNGALCYTLQIEYPQQNMGCMPNFPSFSLTGATTYTWTDATGTVVANAQLYVPGGNGSLTFGYGTNVMTSVCNFGDGEPCTPPTLVPQCGGATGPCPYRPDGGSP